MFSGSIPALVTPFEDRGDHVGGAFDEGRFRDFVEWQIEQGSSALVACGTTGEAATMPKDEHFHVVRVCVDQARGRVPVIAGAGSNDTIVAVENLKAAQAAGARDFQAWVGTENYEMRVAPDGSWVDRKVLDIIRGTGA